MNREELEAAIRRQLTYLARHAITANEAVDAVLAAADAYAAHTAGDIIAARHQVIKDATGTGGYHREHAARVPCRPAGAS